MSAWRSLAVTDMAEQYLATAFNTFDRVFVGMRPCQISLYTIVATFALIMTKRLLSNILYSDKKLTSRIKSTVFSYVRKIGPVQKKVDKELEKTRADIEHSIHKFDKERSFFTQLPPNGISKSKICELAKKYKSMGEFSYEDGKVSGTVYTDEPKEHRQLLNEMFDLYAYANPLHADVFPGNRKMEAEIVRMLCNLFRGGPSSCGTTTSGGTESIMLACMAYRNRAYKLGISEPEILAGMTAHAAFDKAAAVCGMRLHRVDLDPTSAAAIHRAVSRNTCMLVASAPNFISGSIDPIGEIARIGQRYGIPVHVDACLGGFLLPFMEDCGYFVEPFDFRVKGVTSISCDTHKYGYCPKGSSVIMYADKSYIHHQYLSVADWSGGIYGTPTFAGSRCGANIALTWATLLYYGQKGYTEAARKILNTTKQIRNGLETIDGIEVIGRSDVSVVAFGSRQFNIYALSDMLAKRGWNLNPMQHPAAVHICVTINQTKVGVVDRLLKDVKEVVETIKKDPSMEHSNTAVIYGMAASIPESLMQEVINVYLDTCYSMPSLDPQNKLHSQRS